MKVILFLILLGTILSCKVDYTRSHHIPPTGEKIDYAKLREERRIRDQACYQAIHDKKTVKYRKNPRILSSRYFSLQYIDEYLYCWRMAEHD